MQKTKKHNIDIFELLSKIDTKNHNYFTTLSKKEQTAFQPVVISRWLSGTNDSRQVYFLNELVNQYTFPLASHKDLLYKLLTICTSGKVKRYKWKKTAARKKSKTPVTASVVKEFFGYNSIEAEAAINLLSDANILEYASSLGRQQTDITKIKKELKNRPIA